MFSKSLLASIVFLGTFSAQIALAYKSEGVERINPTTIISQATKEGLEIPANERATKKELQRLKKSQPKEFDKKLAQGIENSSIFQGYLLEIKEGLQQTEKAKKIAKITLFKKIKSDWNLLKTSALNTRVDTSFKDFSRKLKSDLESIYYIKFEDGYVFQVGQWGYATVAKNLKTVMWKIEFNSKYDKNRLEEGAENIQILEDNSQSSDGGSDESSAPSAPAAPEEKSQFD